MGQAQSDHCSDGSMTLRRPLEAALGTNQASLRREKDFARCDPGIDCATGVQAADIHPSHSKFEPVDRTSLRGRKNEAEASRSDKRQSRTEEEAFARAGMDQRLEQEVLAEDGKGQVDDKDLEVATTEEQKA